MQTKNIVQASANVIRITNLQRGDIYKRFEDSSYDSGYKYGIVKNVYNNGDTTFIEAIEYKKSYRELTASIKIIKGAEDVAIFPTTIEEITEEFGTAETDLKKQISDKKEELEKLEVALETATKLISGQLQAELQTPSFKEMTQGEFNKKKLELSATVQDI